MNRRKAVAVALLLLLSGFLCVQLVAPRVAMAQGYTVIPGGEIEEDTTLTAEGSPYLSERSITVAEGATLTIEPGVELYFDEPIRGLSVRGGLVANGTAEAPITFSGLPAEPGSWEGLFFYPTASVRLRHCEVAYGGGYIYAAIHIESSDVTIEQCRVHHSKRVGVGLKGANLTPTLHDVELTDNVRAALYQDDANMRPSLANLTMARNGTNAVVSDGGTLTSDTALRVVGAGIPYHFERSITVAEGVTLTVEPGVTVAFMGDELRGLSVRGSLVASGTAEAPVAFTGRPTPGSWDSLYIYPTGSVQLRHCEVAYAGGYVYAAVHIQSSDVTIEACHVHHSKRDGVVLAGANLTPTLHDVALTDNVRAALYQDDANMRPSLANLAMARNGTNAVVSDGGTLTSDTTLRVVGPGIPYHFERSVEVAEGVTLTVEPGVTVAFMGDELRGLSVRGSLVANGTIATPVTFTGRPTPGSWDSLYIYPTGSVQLRHCEVAYAGGYTYAAIHIESSDVTIEQCRVHHSKREGIGLEGANLTPTLHNVDLTDNVGAALYQDDANMRPSLVNITMARNGTSAVVSDGGTLTSDTALRVVGADIPYHFSRSVEVAEGVTLTVEPGVTVAFMGDNQRGLSVRGGLVANGTAEAPIAFTGRTTPGSWLGLYFYATASVQLEHCEVAYGGGEGYGALYTASSRVSVRNCRLHHSDDAGIEVAGNAQPSLRFNQITENSAGLINRSSAATVDARLNWWGHASGPRHAGANPAGRGDTVSDRVLFAPWLRLPVGSAGDRAARTLAPGTTSAVTVESGRLADFVYEAEGGENLVVTVRARRPAGAPTLLLHRAGSLPLLVNQGGDDWTDQPEDGAYTLILLDVLPGPHYFTIAPQTSEGSVQYEIRLTSHEHYLASVSPTVVAATPMVIEASGVFRFARLETLWLCDGTRRLRQGALDQAGQGKGIMTIDLTGIDSGPYDLCVTWPDGTEQRISNALTVDTELVGELVARVEQPSAVRLGRPYLASLVYGNTGDAPIPSPAFAVTALSGTIHTHLGDPPVKALRVVGLGERVPSNLLMPGEERRVSFYVVPTSLDHRLGLRTFDASNAEAFPWEELEAALRPSPVPGNWADKWERIRTYFGSTWGSVVSRFGNLLAPTGENSEPLLDELLRFWLLTLLADGVSSADAGATRTMEVTQDEPLRYYSGGSSFPYDPAADVTVSLYGGGTFDPNLPTFIITHGNTDNIDNDGNTRYTNVIDKLQDRLARDGKSANFITVEWDEGARVAGDFLSGESDPFAKTGYFNVNGENVIMSAAEEASDDIRRITGGQLRAEDTTAVGHSFGNGVNYEIALELFQGDEKPAAILVDPASSLSGIHINAYSKAFDPERSVALHTESLADETDPDEIGLPTYNIDNEETPYDFFSGRLFARHGYGIDTFLPNILDEGFNPLDPTSVTAYLPDAEREDDREERLLQELDFPDEPPVEEQPVDVNVVRSMDPNDKIAWSAYIRPDGTVRYTIRFENVMTATAAAQEVLITDVLDPDYDPATLRWIAAGFGEHELPVPDESVNRYLEVETIVDDPRAGVSARLQVRLTALLDVPSGQLVWLWETLDPVTGLPPADALAGFLPPNNASGRGEGFVVFEIKPRVGLADGTALDNAASIVFDTNEPIETGQVTTRVDARPPTSTVNPLPTSSPATFTVSWSGDDGGGSGIAFYDVYVSVNGGAWQPWLLGTEATSASYAGASGQQYAFYSVATDRVGYRQSEPAGAQASTVVSAGHALHLPMVRR